METTFQGLQIDLRPQFYLNDRSDRLDRCDHMETTLQRFVAMKNIPECGTSLLVPGPLGYFFNSVAIVAIIWKLVLVRIAQLFVAFATIVAIAAIIWKPAFSTCLVRYLNVLRDIASV